MAGNSLPIVTVIDSGNNILNKTDGTIGFNVRVPRNILLLVQDKDEYQTRRSRLRLQ